MTPQTSASDPMGGAVHEALRGAYEIGELLGEGGFGRVYKARQIATGQAVAIKMLRAQAGASKEEQERMAARFLREMKLCARLHHPNIVRLIDSGRAADGLAYSVFEYAPGKDLLEVLKEEGPLEPLEARHLMGQTLDALACAHAQGVVHRDLKPANLMVVPTGARRNILVLDFGIGALTNAAEREDYATITQTREFLGTPAYAAPEQLRGEPVTPRTDLYAWALVMLECLTGQRAVQGKNAVEVIARQLAPEPVPMHPTIARHPLGALLRRATVKDVRRRDVTAAGLLRELEACDMSTLMRPQLRDDNATLTQGELATVTMGRARPPAVASAPSVKATGDAPSTRLVEGERRQLTALCCAFTPASPGIDEEDGEEADPMRHVHDACSAIARKHDGVPAGALGDTLLFYFGFPAAQEDEAARAASAALEIAAALRPAAGAPAGPRVDFRIGIHTGIVVIRGGTDSSSVRNVSGAPPKLSMRLCELARPGEILASAQTQRILRKRFRLVEVARRTQGGASDLSPLFLLEEGTPEADREGASLVGRARELDLIRERWSRARAGTGHGVLVTGEAGIGKSRLLRAFEDELHDDEQTLLECRCTPDSANNAFYPFIEMLQRLLDHGHGGDARSLDAIHPLGAAQPEAQASQLEALLSRYGFDLDEAMPLFGVLLSVSTGREARDISPQKRREMMKNALLTLFFEMAEQRPLLLVFEDLHWADPSTIELLGQLLGEAAPFRILVLMSARPEFTAPWSSSTLFPLHLGRLERADIAHMMTDLIGGRQYSPDLLDKVADRTDGVPLFVEELVRVMLESGALVEREGMQTMISASEVVIPSTLRDSLMARLDRLGRAKETAQIASVIGREFNIDLLCAVGAQGEEAIQEDLDRLVAAEIVLRKRRLKGIGYLFKHALIRDAAYDSMLKRSRQHVHARIARALEERFPQTAKERPDLLARHLAAAEDKPAAIRYARKAATTALERSAYVEAIALAREAIGWLPSIEDPTQRAEEELALNASIISALMASRGWRDPMLKETADRSLALAAVKLDSAYAAPTLWALALYYAVGGRSHAQVRALSDKLRSLAVSTSDPGPEAAALVHIGHCDFLEGKLAAALASCERALALYDPAIHRDQCFLYGEDIRVGALTSLAWIHWYSGNPDEALSFAEAGIAWAREINHGQGYGLALTYAMRIRYERQERDEVERLCDLHTEAAVRHGLVEQVATGALYRAWAQRDLDAVRQRVEQREAFGIEKCLPAYSCMAAEVEAAHGEVGAALARLDHAAALAGELEEYIYLPKVLCLKGALLGERGDAAAAEACLVEAIDRAQESGARILELAAATALFRLLAPGFGAEGAARRPGAPNVNLSPRAAEARARLASAYGKFKSGLDAPQLAAARSALAATEGVAGEANPCV